MSRVSQILRQLPSEKVLKLVPKIVAALEAADRLSVRSVEVDIGDMYDVFEPEAFREFRSAIGEVEAQARKERGW